MSFYDNLENHIGNTALITEDFRTIGYDELVIAADTI